VGNFSALFFLCLSFAFPLLSPTIRREQGLYLVVCFTLAVRHSLALVNAFVTPLSLSWGDLYFFHDIGMGKYSFEGQPYGLFLRILYKVFGGSFWLGEESSIVAYSLSLVLLVEIARLIGLGNNLKVSILLFGCMPSPAIHTSTTFRESLQVLGLLVALFSMLQLRHRPAPHWLFTFAVGLLWLGFLHQGLAIYIAMLAVLGLPWAIQGRGSLGTVLGLLLLLAMPWVGQKLINSLNEESSSARAFSEGRLLSYAANYRSGVSSARSDYGVKIDPTDLFSFSSSVTTVVAMYFLAPLPWQVSHPMDLYAMGENIARVFLIAGALYLILKSSGELRARRMVLLLAALVLESLWALGTTNWGTALRHHCVVWGVLVFLGTPAYAHLSFDPELTALLRRRERRKALL